MDNQTWVDRFILNGPVGVVLGVLAYMWFMVFGTPEDFE